MSTQAVFSRTPLRKPLQARSRKSLERIYAATNKLLGKKSFDRITVAEIADASGVSVGSIYQRFGSKDDLLWTLYGNYVDTALKSVAALVRQPTPQKAAARTPLVIGLTCTLFRDHRGIVKSLLLKYRSEPETVPAYYVDRIEAVYSAFDKFLQGAGATPKTARDCRAMILAASREHILFGAFDADGGRKKSDADFMRMLTLAATSLLQGKRT